LFGGYNTRVANLDIYGDGAPLGVFPNCYAADGFYFFANNRNRSFLYGG